MNIQKASPDEFDELIKKYKEKSLTQLQSIIPNWAYAKDSDKILDRTLRPKAREHFIFLVNVKELIKISEFYEVNSETLFTGDMLNDGRVARILDHWENKQFVDPPTVGIFGSIKSKLSFSDGRHRTKTSYLLGHLQIPIAIHKSQIDSISKMIKLIPV